MYMARFRLARHRDVRIQDSSGELVVQTQIREDEDAREVLARLHLRLFGPWYSLADNRAFMVAVEPVLKTVVAGPVHVGLDFFHRQVVLSIGDTSVRFENVLEARHTAQALVRAAGEAERLWGGERA